MENPSPGSLKGKTLWGANLFKILTTVGMECLTVRKLGFGITSHIGNRNHYVRKTAGNMVSNKHVELLNGVLTKVMLEEAISIINKLSCIDFQPLFSQRFSKPSEHFTKPRSETTTPKHHWYPNCCRLCVLIFWKLFELFYALHKLCQGFGSMYVWGLSSLGSVWVVPISALNAIHRDQFRIDATLCL